MDQIAVSVEEFCQLTGIGRTRFYEEVRLGRLKLVKSGRRSLVTVAEMQRWAKALPSTS